MAELEQLATGIYKIPFGSKVHTNVIKAFNQRWNLSRDSNRDKREENWKRSEEVCLGYIPEDEEAALRKHKQQNGQPNFTTIAMPYSFAMLLTAHTYYTSVFLARNPIFQVTGRHGESQTAESMVESYLDYQLMSGGGLPALFIWLLDPGKYGYGVLGHYWDEEVIRMTNYVDEPQTFMGIPTGKFVKKLVSKELKGFVGNRLYNVRPQDFFPDPRVPVYRFQEGEFCIVYEKVIWTVLAEEAARGKMFNLEHVKKSSSSEMNSNDRDLGSDQMDLPGENLSFYNLHEDKPSQLDQYTFHWNVVPREMGLGSGNAPEKWAFKIIDKKYIVSAQPLGLAHNKYPYDVIPFEVEGYNLFSRGMVEMLEPLNNTMEWLINSHFYNVRASLNNMFLFDPTCVEQRDLENPDPGKWIRLKPAARSRDPRSYFQQLSVGDITRSHLQDTEIVGSLAQRMVGVNENIMGMVNAGGRKTATEVRSSTSFGINRLKTNCEWFSAVGFTPLTHKLVASSQQLYDLERKFRIVGDQAQWGEKYLNVTPEGIAGFYDFVPVDGTMPVDRFAQANLWQQLLTNLGGSGLLAGYDVAKIFAFVAQLGGIKNIDKFRIQVMPDQAVMQAAQAGNVLPMRANLNEPGQIPGMGVTG